MPLDPEVFRHHPGLAAQIRDPEDCVFRHMEPADHDPRMRELGFAEDWRFDDATRNRMLDETLKGRCDRDLWVFGYGSLMWNPGFYFSEVRRARVEGLHRSFCLVDRMGARGDASAPGLMAALDLGGSVEGLAFRIPACNVRCEADYVWKREMIAPGYIPVFVPAETAQGPVEVLSFRADHAVEMMDPTLDHATKVRYIATGRGFLGTSREYLENVVAHCRCMKIEDPELEQLMHDVTAFPALPGNCPTQT
ncbi:gamma-glutamylcyclotransferase [Pseudooceanicola sp. CBS1P-1]|uniref:glutathione-specific gamma-glutamylcyclotransferase n=1 Tax=Pseudooceanicola albus TaxID=2692189 RepID=A0A6L7G045_9RHOB|nr:MULTISPECIES: gamma-glutamylcyclotransferase [Pseudooceanicola]MBT9382771.1 gamma-glutamylcyclotransferase [Pseudooceanicola endophyticus]MXN17309.1 gamma-glutamylcyclotransferase [Pseudooceanicola albus]